MSEPLTMLLVSALDVPVDWLSPIQAYGPGAAVLAFLVWGVRKVTEGRKVLAEENKTYHDSEDGRNVHVNMMRSFLKGEEGRKIARDHFDDFVGGADFQRTLEMRLEAERLSNERVFSARLGEFEQRVMVLITSVAKEVAESVEVALEDKVEKLILRETAKLATQFNDMRREIKEDLRATRWGRNGEDKS